MSSLTLIEIRTYYELEDEGETYQIEASSNGGVTFFYLGGEVGDDRSGEEVTDPELLTHLEEVLIEERKCVAWSK